MKRNNQVLQLKNMLNEVGEHKSWTEKEKKQKAETLKDVFGYTKDEADAIAKQTRRKAMQGKIGQRLDESDEEAIESYNDRLEQVRKEVYTAEEHKELYGYDLSPESVRRFLRNAPAEAKKFFMSNSMSDDEKLKAMNTFRYNATTIDILDEQGNIVETMEKEDYTVPDSELQPGMIEKDETGNTHFSFVAIKHDELVLTDTEWQRLLNLMPAGDYSKVEYRRCRAGKQLHALLGGKLSGFRSGGRTYDVGDCGCFRSRSVSHIDYSFALISDPDEQGLLYFYNRTDLRPVRRRAKSAG